MRRAWLVAATAVTLAGAGLVRADSPPPMAPGSSADGYPPTTHFETSCTNKCTSGRDGNAVSHVVFLSSEGGKDATIATWQFDAGKSIHYFVANDGSVADFVPEADTAWYAGDLTYNETSIGIIVEGFVSTPSSFGDLDYQRAAQLVAAISHRYQFPIDATHVLGRGSIPNTTYTGTGPDPSFDLVRLRTLAQQYRDELDPPPPPPPPTTGTTDSTPPPPSADATPPVVTLSGPRTQALAPTLVVGLGCPSERCTVTGRGTIRVLGRRHRLPTVTATVAPGAGARAAFRLSTRLRKVIKRALRAHRKVVATLTFVAVDAAGNRTTVTRRVTLRR